MGKNAETRHSDIEALKILSREGRLSKADLDARIDLNPSACWQRAKRPEQAQVIEDNHADIRVSRAVRALTIFVMVGNESHRAEAFRKFGTTVLQFEEVAGCWALGGG